MSELDLPALPALPEPRPEDVEDVSWALSTAEAMWARGDHAEGVKWVRKAAEAAADAEDDARALELAKTASDLAAAIARRSMPSAGDPGQRVAEPPPPPSQEATVPGVDAATILESVTAPPAAGASSTPPPLPARASAKPPRSVSPPRPPASASIAPRPGPPSKAPRPLASSVKPPDSARDPKKKRRTRDNLDDAARAAGVHIDTRAPETQIETRESPLASTSEVPALAQHLAATRPPAGGVVAPAIEWDRSPTQALSGDELAALEGDRQTSFGAPPPQVHLTEKVRPQSKSLHDEDIRTTQAVRVVVWKDASGVHVAPEGTVVSAITTSAMLVALEPSADLTAWLSRRGR